MLKEKKKISRKEIKQDKLVTAYYNVQDFLEEHQQKLLMAAGALAVIIVLIVVYMQGQEDANLEASAKLGKVISYYDNGSYQQAIDGIAGTDVIGLRGIVEEYGGTQVGERAKVYLANSLYYLAKFQEAKDYYESYSGDDPLFKATSYAGIANCYLIEEDYESAAGYYEDAASFAGTNPNNPDYLLKAGINYTKVNKNEKAEELLKKLKKQYPDSQQAAEADRYLAAAGL